MLNRRYILHEIGENNSRRRKVEGKNQGAGKGRIEQFKLSFSDFPTFWFSGSLFFSLSLIFIMLGCHATPPKRITNFGLSSFFEPERIIRIAVMPLGSEVRSTRGAKVEGRFTDELTVQLLKVDRFELVDKYKVDELMEYEGLTGDELNEAIVKKIGKKLGAEAIILGKITRYKKVTPKLYIFSDPPVVGVNLRMVSVKDGSTIWTVNEVFDAGDKSVQAFVPKEERERLKTDVDFLIQAACNEIAKTLDF